MTWQQILEKAGYPTTAIVLDFETYFDINYSLKKMSTIEYVKDSRFEVGGLGIQYLGLPSGFAWPKYLKQPIFYKPNEIEEVLNTLKNIDIPNINELTVICQNCKFDCLVLQEYYGITPKYTVDIIDLAKIQDARAKRSLEALAKRNNAPSLKGDTQQFKGYHWNNMSEEMKKDYEEYCKNDVLIESFLFQKLLPLVPNPHIELPLATQTLQLYLKPQIKVDIEFGEELKKKMELEMIDALDKVDWVLSYAD